MKVLVELRVFAGSGSVTGNSRPESAALLAKVSAWFIVRFASEEG